MCNLRSSGTETRNSRQIELSNKWESISQLVPSLTPGELAVGLLTIVRHWATKCLDLTEQPVPLMELSISIDALKCGASVNHGSTTVQKFPTMKNSPLT